MKSLFTLFVLLITALQSSATVVIAVKKKDAIYIGADSKISYNSPNMPSVYEKGKNDTFHKIWSNGSCGFLIQGQFINDTREMAIEACENSNSIDSIISHFDKNFAPYFGNKLQYFKSNNRAYYDRFVRDNYPGLVQIYFFSNKNNILRGVGKLYTIDTIIDRTMDNITVLVGEEEKTIYGAGNIDEVLAEIKDSATWEGTRRRVVKKIIDIIRRQSIRHPIQVNSNIAILEFTTKGSRWIKKYE